jgi:hypothetical protein
MDHRAFLELAAGAALDDLDAAEQAALDAHLAGCPECGAEARALVDTAGLLAWAVPQRRPAPSLRDSVMAAIGATAPGNVAPAAVGALGGAPIPAAARPPARLLDARRDRARDRRPLLVGLAMAAVLAIAVGALGTTVIGLDAELQRTAAERDAALALLASTDQAMAVVLAPDHATAALAPEPMAEEATIQVVYRPGTSDAWLLAEGLPALPAGSVYQLWSADAAGVHGLATFTCAGSGVCMAPYGVDLGAATATMITVEPAGGATGEPGPQVAFGELSG